MHYGYIPCNIYAVPGIAMARHKSRVKMWQHCGQWRCCSQGNPGKKRWPRCSRGLLKAAAAARAVAAGGCGAWGRGSQQGQPGGLPGARLRHRGRRRQWQVRCGGGGGQCGRSRPRPIVVAGGPAVSALTAVGQPGLRWAGGRAYVADGV